MCWKNCALSVLFSNTLHFNLPSLTRKKNSRLTSKAKDWAGEAERAVEVMEQAGELHLLPELLNPLVATMSLADAHKTLNHGECIAVPFKSSHTCLPWLSVRPLFSEKDAKGAGIVVWLCTSTTIRWQRCYTSRSRTHVWISGTSTGTWWLLLCVCGQGKILYPYYHNRLNGNSPGLPYLPLLRLQCIRSLLVWGTACPEVIAGEGSSEVRIHNLRDNIDMSTRH